MANVLNTCCFTGHREAKLPWGENEQDVRCLELKANIAKAVCYAYDEGIRHYIVGMASGCDLYFAEAVLHLRSVHPDITLEAAVPFPAQAENWRRICAHGTRRCCCSATRERWSPKATTAAA